MSSGAVMNIRRSTPIVQISRTIISPLPSQIAKEAPILIQEEIILKRGGKLIVNQGFDETDSASVAQGATVDLLTVSVPSGSDQYLLITHFGNDLGDIAAWTKYTWNMTIDGIPVKSYYGVKSQLGYTSQMRRVSVDILVGGGQTLKVSVVGDAVIPGAPYDVLVSLQGVYGTYDYQKG